MYIDIDIHIREMTQIGCGGIQYKSTETKINAGLKTVRKVSVKKGKGYKQITKYRGGKKISTVKKSISSKHMQQIKDGKFIVGLFDDCKNCNNNKKTRKMRL